jgi:outer membrane immunogenic protein
MKKIALATTALFILSAGAASAADLAARPYTKAPPAPLAAVYNWTGFYIGGNAGYSWADTNVDYIFNGALLAAASHTERTDGFIGGGQVGYNWQAGNWVFGVEADAAWRDTKNTTTFAFANGLDFTTFSTRRNWLATFRPRVGVAANNWLFYVTGGAAVEDIEHSFTENRPTLAGAFRSATVSDTRWGWTVGAGVEAGFGQWSAGLEYLYASFDKTTTIAFPAQVLGGLPFTANSANFHDRNENILRAKLNYHFGGPVVAKY